MKHETQAGMPTKGLLLARITEHLRQLEEDYAMASHLVADEDKTFSFWLLKSSELTKLELNMVLNWFKRGKPN